MFNNDILITRTTLPSLLLPPLLHASIYRTLGPNAPTLASTFTVPQSMLETVDVPPSRSLLLRLLPTVTVMLVESIVIHVQWRRASGAPIFIKSALIDNPQERERGENKLVEYSVDHVPFLTSTFLSRSWCKWGEGVHLEWLIVNGGGSPLARRNRHEASLRLMGGGGGSGGRRGGRRGGGRSEGLVTLPSHEVPDEDGISTTDDSAAVLR